MTLHGDAREFHRFAVEWAPDSVTFFIDGSEVRRTDHSPGYPVQLMLDLFHYPPESGEAVEYPQTFTVDWVRGYRRRVYRSATARSPPHSALGMTMLCRIESTPRTDTT